MIIANIWRKKGSKPPTRWHWMAWWVWIDCDWWCSCKGATVSTVKSRIRSFHSAPLYFISFYGSSFDAIPSGNLLQFAIENGHLEWVFFSKHCDFPELCYLLVYQRVGEHFLIVNQQDQAIVRGFNKHQYPASMQWGHKSLRNQEKFDVLQSTEVLGDTLRLTNIAMKNHHF